MPTWPALTVPLARSLLAAQGLFAFLFPLVNAAFVFLPMGWVAALLGPIYVSAFIPPLSIVTGPLAVVAAWRLAAGRGWAFVLALFFELLWLISPIELLQTPHLPNNDRGPGAVIALVIGLIALALLVVAATSTLRRRSKSQASAASVKPLIFGMASASLVIGALVYFGLSLTLSNQEVSYSELISHPEARLYFPGSQVISAQGAGEDQRLDVHRWATFTSELRTDASASEVLSWYDRELASRGWVLRKTDPYNAEPGRIYTLGRREQFQVSIAGDGTYGTIFMVLPAGCGTDDTAFHNCTGF